MLRLVCKDTIEPRVLEYQRKKRGVGGDQGGAYGEMLEEMVKAKEREEAVKKERAEARQAVR